MNKGREGGKTRPQEGVNSKELIFEMTNKIEKLLTRLIKKEKTNIMKTEKWILTPDTGI